VHQKNVARTGDPRHAAEDCGRLGAQTVAGAPRPRHDRLSGAARRMVNRRGFETHRRPEKRGLFADQILDQTIGPRHLLLPIFPAAEHVEMTVIEGVIGHNMPFGIHSPHKVGPARYILTDYKKRRLDSQFAQKIQNAIGAAGRGAVVERQADPRIGSIPSPPDHFSPETAGGREGSMYCGNRQCGRRSSGGEDVSFREHGFRFASGRANRIMLLSVEDTSKEIVHAPGTFDGTTDNRTVAGLHASRREIACGGRSPGLDRRIRGLRVPTDIADCSDGSAADKRLSSDDAGWSFPQGLCSAYP